MGARATVLAILLALCAQTALPACVPSGDFDGTAYRCDESPTCPSGFHCVAGSCVAGSGGGPGDGGPGDGGPGDSGRVEVPAGTVEMGCDAAAPGCPADAQPARQVTIAAFAIDTTEVTEAAYAECVAAAACTAPDDFNPGSRPDAPVRGVAWADAADYCRFRGARLPTEAEWERAARGDDGRRYPWGDDPPGCDRARLAGCASPDGPVDTGTLAGQSPFGARDLLGNVAEWVADWYQSDYYSSAPDANPSGPGSGGERVRRGGSYLDAAADVSAWSRAHANPLHRDPDVGFRCVR